MPSMIAHFAGALVALAVCLPAADAAERSETTAAAFAFDGLEGGKIRLASYVGKPVLVVNTASRCGFAGQLGDLGELWTRYRDRGLAVIAVPSDDFRQEPGDAATIRSSAESHHATFPFAAKQHVTGDDAHPFYRWTARSSPDAAPRWNFHKYLIGADGGVVASFGPSTRPTDPKVVAAIERELNAAGAVSVR
ncbi:glutathione peroxidase [Methylopila sp. 73B]|uniref:glutathione peroxidase n=1 Tax=Methylopila sp. 73B TaxID=1120792 RepID=UPI00037088EF|nr:glutathione peroxidase [Methylopila sp. 73B]